MLQDFWAGKRDLRPPSIPGRGRTYCPVPGLRGPAPWPSVYLMAPFLGIRITRPNRKANDRKQINSECIKENKKEEEEEEEEKAVYRTNPRERKRGPVRTWGEGQ